MALSRRESFNAHLLYAPAAVVQEKTGLTKPAPKRVRNTDRIPEWREQQAVIEWWAVYSRTKGYDERLLMAIPNGSFMRGGLNERKVQLIILRKTGTRPGAPDLLLAMPKPPYAGLFVEMKAADGRTSVDQDEMLALLQKQGYRTETGYGADEAIAAIKGYLG